MNKDRRKLLSALSDGLAEIQAHLQQAHEEEQEYFDNMPEGIQSSEKGETAEAAAYALSDAADLIDQVLEQILLARGE